MKKSAAHSDSRPHIRSHINVHIPSHIHTYIRSHINAHIGDLGSSRYVARAAFLVAACSRATNTDKYGLMYSNSKTENDLAAFFRISRIQEIPYSLSFPNSQSPLKILNRLFFSNLLNCVRIKKLHIFWNLSNSPNLIKSYTNFIKNHMKTI